MLWRHSFIQKLLTNKIAVAVQKQQSTEGKESIAAQELHPNCPFCGLRWISLKQVIWCKPSWVLTNNSHVECFVAKKKWFRTWYRELSCEYTGAAISILFSFKINDNFVSFVSYRLVFGTLYPAYSSYKAMKTKNVREYVSVFFLFLRDLDGISFDR